VQRAHLPHHPLGSVGEMRVEPFVEQVAHLER
jgi:hypothetical protein